ncbi:aldose epimerase family protein [Mucilaginibacter myungsuensis]|uniref:Aldose 1-epimerase n=1 Tax=Mucilaginibacter myungsuensis TaxID=649104 RepID=A0A929PV53_9SPHI|nr:aldose epimerase family protein [Mucilaginibacter myungsuensis]MBE9660636.1 galactose mutarotase [Mucilaginibacter myungsuensis]MDN3600681.1 aldose epimerase family protein [Mucilaginibacter myungsuensis]
MTERITYRPWSNIGDQPVYLFCLRNSSGAYIEVSNYGATLVNIMVPDRAGQLGSVVLGFADLYSYLKDNCYIGSTIGRYANRISNARFELNEETYQLDANDGPNSNHSGAAGFNSKMFGFEIHYNELVLTLDDTDDSGGFPGSLNLRVTYNWTDDNQLTMRYQAVADADTYVNLTNHAYFNLSGKADILGHQLTISGRSIVESDRNYIPTGNIVEAGELLFKGNTIADKIGHKPEVGDGINSYYILDDELKVQNRFSVKLSEQTSGRLLTIDTSYPGLFVYTGDYLLSAQPGHQGDSYQPFGGLCLECQLYPDAMNRPEFPSALLPKHQVYDQYIKFKFGTDQ